MLVVLLACLLGTTVAAPVQDECPRIMSEAGLSTAFAPMVTHSIHSLTLEDIRNYFKSDATENNGIPTVNLDLTSEHRVIPHAPLVGYDEDFSTMGLKSFDLVMRNMDRTWWGVTNYSVLEKVAHALHMAEMWNQAMAQYKYIGKLLNPESDICACVTDIENNGVLNHLNLLAFKIRYPGITSGDANITDHYLAATNLTDPESEDSLGREKRSPIWDSDYGVTQEIARRGGTSVEVGAGKSGPSLAISHEHDFGGGFKGGVKAEIGLGGPKVSASASYDAGGFQVGGKASKSLVGGSVGGSAGYNAGGNQVSGRAEFGTGGIAVGGGYSAFGFNYDAGYSFKAPWARRGSLNFDDIDFSLSDIQLLKDVVEKLVDGDVIMIDHLDSAEHWTFWKNMLKVPEGYRGHYDLAMFVFCMLN